MVKSTVDVVKAAVKSVQHQLAHQKCASLMKKK